MKGIIIYYSNTGNTLLACKYLAHNLPDVVFDFCNILNHKKVNLDNYNVVGFATFTDSWESPKLFVDYIMALKQQKHKPAFLLNTYGYISGKTLRTLNRSVSAKGFLVMCGHSLQTPENSPPMIRLGISGRNHPGNGKLKKFYDFVILLEQFMNAIKNHGKIIPRKIKIGFLNTILPSFPRKIIKVIMGRKSVEPGLCISCGECMRNCPGSAISLKFIPVFDENKCHSCWACYNKCPEKAIYTTNYRGRCHYPGPNDELKKKLQS